MIDLVRDNLYFLAAALLIGIATARWAFPNKPPPAAAPKQEDEPKP